LIHDGWVPSLDEVGSALVSSHDRTLAHSGQIQPQRTTFHGLGVTIEIEGVHPFVVSGHHAHGVMEKRRIARLAFIVGCLFVLLFAFLVLLRPCHDYERLPASEGADDLFGSQAGGIFYNEAARASCHRSL